MKRSTAILLVLAIVALLVVNSADFFFRTPFYETWDSAANALSVDQAKHFAQLYGPYSRWGFYHPGPTLFYLQALGEWLFFNWLHWAPAPYNAQTLLYLFFSVGFFVEALRVFSRWLPAGRWRWWFLCAALVAAVLHFTAVGALPSYDPVLGPNVFFSLWSAHALVLPCLCLLAAGASVAAGGGEELPVLALVDGYLLQTHVAQPLFVLPLTALAVGGLVWQCAAQEQDRIGREWSRRRRITLRLSAGWRAFRRAHVLAAIILGFFALPVLIDLRSGTHSNMAAIVQHLRAHRGEHKTLIRSLCYFLQFGGYAPYQPDTIEFKAFTRAGMFAYLRAHGLVFAWWTLGLGSALWALSGAVRRPESSPAGRPEETAAWRGLRPDRQRFLAWAAAFLLAAVGLTLKWGTIQDGAMYYYNAWFNFAIYYFGALIALASLCGWVLSLGRIPASAPRWPERLAGVAVVALAGAMLAGPLRARDAHSASTLAFHESIAQMLAVTAAADGGVPVPRILHFPVGVWVTVAGVALEMERTHLPFYVEDGWGVTFGSKHEWQSAAPGMIRRLGVQNWYFDYLPGKTASAATREGVNPEHLPIVTPLLDSESTGWGDYLYLRRSVPGIDPNGPEGARIDLRVGRNKVEYEIGGWSNPEPAGTWSNSHNALLEFRCAPVPAGAEGVDITFLGVVPHVDPARGLSVERLRVYFNGEPLGDERPLTSPLETLTYRVPEERWNRAASTPLGGRAMLELELPDAISTAELYPESTNQDTRMLGIVVREIHFQAVPPPPPPSTSPAPGPAK